MMEPGNEILGGLDWRLLGPHRGGRVVAVAGDVFDPAVFYFGAAAGGVWKTNDAGTSWRNVSDGFFGTAAVGALAVSCSDPNVIYAGTGESTIRGDVSHGDGVYKSVDGGRTWSHIGLRDTRHIGCIVIHPENPDIAYVAALGHAWGPNRERGVFRTVDGGKTWVCVLFRSERAGSHDLTMDLANPRILYAAVWQAQRYPHALWSGGPDCGLWRSTDGGDHWEDISRRPGLPAGLLGKIGVGASPAQPGRVWALVEADDGAMFRSDDYGETWVRLSRQPLLRTRPWYYMHVTPDPSDGDTVYVQNYGLWKSIDAGAVFTQMPSPHGDEPALWIDPRHPRRMIKGDDGGAAVSLNGGLSWSTQLNQPTAQLYHVTTDNQFPYRIYGSQQDNSAISLPSRSVEGPIHEREWFPPGGGESGYIAVKPDNPNLVVASGPAGRRAYNDVMTLYDRRTRQRWDNTVWPELYGWGVGAESLKYRFQWTFPILFSQHDPDLLYVAGNHVFRSTTLGARWELASPDLTRNDHERLRPSGGPITRDNTGAEVYCTIFSLAESPLQPGVLWAGSDDGLVHLSRDHARTWENVTPPPDLLPEWALISIIEPSPHHPGTAYLAATRYKLDDVRPYLLRTKDYGATWDLVTDGIPADDFTRVIREDPTVPGLLYAGTETGLYVLGHGRWHRLQGGVPVSPVYDLVIQGDEMVVATHGRSFWVLDDLNPLREWASGFAGEAAHLFRPKPAVRLRTDGGFDDEPVPGFMNYGRAGTSTVAAWVDRNPDGSLRFEPVNAGVNPPTGVVLHYWLREAPQAPPTLEILDNDGRPLRVYRDGVPARAGMNRLVWNLRLPGAAPVRGQDLEPWHRPHGPMVLPGHYQARLTVDGVLTTVPVEVAPDPRVATPLADLEAQLACLLDILTQLSRCNRAINRIDAVLPRVRDWLGRTSAEAVTSTGGRVVAELETVRGALIDVHMPEAQLWPSGLHEKLNALFSSVDSADYAPPMQAREVLAELTRQLESWLARLGAVESGPLQEMEEAIRRAGLPLLGVVTPPGDGPRS
jgi:photosystem II stability/assembly factor-like uncharacterized protein